MMNLTGIISISGKPGLYKVVAQAKNSVIVESLEDNKRVPAYATDRISALEDISIYTYGEDKPLKEIYTDIFNKENGGATLSHKDDIKKLTAYLTEILPDYDQERVYSSDIKKLFQWYNLLHKSGNLKLEEEVAEEVVEVEAAAEVTEEVAVEEVVEAAAEVTEEVAVEEVVEAVAEETTEAPAAEENNEEKEA